MQARLNLKTCNWALKYLYVVKSIHIYTHIYKLPIFYCFCFCFCFWIIVNNCIWKVQNVLNGCRFQTTRNYASLLHTRCFNFSNDASKYLYTVKWLHTKTTPTFPCIFSVRCWCTTNEKCEEYQDRGRWKKITFTCNFKSSH